ncbi:ATP-dependent helicase [Azospirillum canadense]|uniref:ATP-dependent helicase n=1 Tax=Azospirillum canadense TaxID=403962 RepID=UPI002226A286|nr:ATP-dependent helicase [Azospirillum canadense]MCW2240721.1 superfamily I DNA/RNA helicase [Azospirillum canadense]
MPARSAPLRKPLDVAALALPPQAEAAIAAGTLNRAQAAAVYAPLSPTLVLGPPGTGKTKSATDRIGHLLDHGITPDSLFIGTFTQASAIEITGRVNAAHGGRFRPKNPNDQLMVGTLNALGLRILRALERNGALKANTLMRGTDARDLCRRLGIDLRYGNRKRRSAADSQAAPPHPALGTPPNPASRVAPPASDLGWFGAGFGGSDDLTFGTPPAVPSRGAQVLQSLLCGKTPAAILLGPVHDLPFLDVVARWKEKLITPQEALRIATGASGSGATADEALAALARDYDRYVAAQRDSQVIDFSDQIALPVLLLRETPRYLTAFQNRWKALLIDEYQDVNTALGALVDLLAGGHRHLWCVGDPDQTLYGFRGSDPNYILQFQDRWPDAQIIALTENYRCRPTIVAAANRLIRHNKDRYETALTATRADVVLPDPIGHALATPSRHGSPGPARAVAIEVVTYPDDLTEAQDTARKVRGLLDAGVPPEQIAVLWRASYRAYHVTQALRGQGIPLRILRGSESSEPEESQLVDGLLRGAHYPAAGLGYTDADTLKRLLSAGGTFDAMKDAAARLKDARGSGALATWTDLCLAVQNLLFAAFAQDAVDQAPGSAAPPHASGEAQAPAPALSRTQARILSAVQAAVTAGSYEAWCAAASVSPAPTSRGAGAPATSNGAETPGITVSTLGTIHGSKGLEFDHVFLPGVENDTCPQNGDAANEEERRLAYVAMTRARDTLTVSHANHRAGDRYPAKPSVYIEEALFGTPGIAWTDYADASSPATALDLDALEAASTRRGPHSANSPNQTRTAPRPLPPASVAPSARPSAPPPAPPPSSPMPAYAAGPHPVAPPPVPPRISGAPWPPLAPPMAVPPLDLPAPSPFAAPGPVVAATPPLPAPAPMAVAAPTPVFTLRVDGGGDACTPWRVTLLDAAGTEIYRSLVNPAGNWLTLVAATAGGIDPTLLNTAPYLDVVADNVLITLGRATGPNRPRPILHLPGGLSSLADLGLTQHLTPEAFDLRPVPSPGG